MTILDPARNAWLAAPATRKVMKALCAGEPGTHARFVGGAVRNALLGRPIDDVDIATPLAPQAVVRRLIDAGIKVVPTGIAHGTVTAVVEGQPFEITSLRRDIRTDGRHAEVTFGGSWAEDAARRDFTMNALYASAVGEVFDFVGGLSDLSAGKVRFIGDPTLRLREDYLRSLRLFRFHAWYGQGEIDPAALAAASQARTGLRSLSGERIAKEMLKLLAARDPSAVLRQMAEAGILAEILPGGRNVERLTRLCALDRRYGFEADALLRLAALAPDTPALSARWHLSKAQVYRLANVMASSPLSAGLSHVEARKRLFRQGDQPFRDRLFLAWADDIEKGHDPAWYALLELTEMFSPPQFPLTGNDAILLGIPPGETIGKALGAVRRWWVEEDFLPSRTLLIERLNAWRISNSE